MTAAALEMRGVVKRYGRREALAGLDLTVPSGSVFGLVGSNGAGKTTAMAVAVGLLRTAAGSVRVLGDGPFNPAQHAGRVTLLPQDSRLPLHSRVGELLVHYACLQGMEEAAARESVDVVLGWVHLEDRRSALVRTLSHGMMRRLTIAQAFLGQPELVLLDEPLSGLDPRETARIRDVLGRRRDGLTVVISSHNLREIEALCDHVAFIERGRLVRQDTLENITGRGHRICYELRPGPLPLAKLAAALPDVKWAASPDGSRLEALYPGPADRVSAVNAAVLSVLLAEGVGLVEVRRGADLESEYLATVG